VLCVRAVAPDGSLLYQFIHALVYFLYGYVFVDQRLIRIIVNDLTSVGDLLGGLVDFLGCLAQVPGIP